MEIHPIAKIRDSLNGRRRVLQSQVVRRISPGRILQARVDRH